MEILDHMRDENEDKYRGRGEGKAPATMACPPKVADRKTSYGTG